MKLILSLVLTLLLSINANATLTVGNVPVTKTGGSSPVMQNSDITDISGNVGIGTATPRDVLDIVGNLRLETSPSLGGSVINEDGNMFYNVYDSSINGGINYVTYYSALPANPSGEFFYNGNTGNYQALGLTMGDVGNYNAALDQHVAGLELLNGSTGGYTNAPSFAIINGLTGATPFFISEPSDNVGIGTFAPLFELQINAPSTYTIGTGGTITSYVSGGITYEVHTFNSSATFTAPTGVATLHILAIAGGGGSGRGNGSAAANGGAGGGGHVDNLSYATASGAVVVGVAGAAHTGGNGVGGNGGDSTFGTIDAVGGGGGAVGVSGSQNGLSGGSGGGAAGTPGTGGAATAGQGFAGGSGDGVGSAGAGGGGAGGAGANNSVNNGGNGGIGYTSAISGVSRCYAGGGAGGGNGGGGSGAGTATCGGGNAAATSGTQGTAGTTNTGGGAGASGYSNQDGVAGGSGTVIISYAVPALPQAVYIPSGTIGVNTSSGTGVISAKGASGSNTLDLKNSSSVQTLSVADSGNLYALGNVGIGSVTPGQVLDVNGNARVIGTNQIIMGSDNSVTIGASAASSGAMLFNTNSVEKMRILANGNVGIGNTAPTQALQVGGSSNYSTISSSGILTFKGTGVYQIDTNTYAFQAQAAPLAGIYFSGTTNAFENRNQSGAAELVVDGTGSANNYFVRNLGVGASFNGITNASKLGVSGNVGIGINTSSSYITTAAPSGGLIVEGNVGIGSVSPGQKLDVQGTIRGISGGTCTTLYKCNGGVDAGVIQTSACVLCPASTCSAMNGCF